METVVIIGGGASGMMAALTAAESRRHIVLLERQQRVARKLLATGNGRCNLTNTGAGAANYHGRTPNSRSPRSRASHRRTRSTFFMRSALSR